MDGFLKELGIGFAYIGNEVKIGDRYNYVDFWFLNVKFNYYIVVELKTSESILDKLRNI